MTNNNLEVGRGTAVNVGQVIDPDLAIELGRLRQEFTGPARNDVYGTPSRRLSIKDVAKTEIQLEAMQSVGLFLDGLVQLGEHRAKPSVADFFIGAAVRGEWHIDIARDWRLLTNLSEFPVYLDIATVWDGRQWVEPSTSDDPPYPIETERITYSPGHGVLIDNNFDQVSQLPHRGMQAAGKVLLRTFARSLDV